MFRTGQKKAAEEVMDRLTCFRVVHWWTKVDYDFVLAFWTVKCKTRGGKDIKWIDYSLHVYFSHSELQVQSAVQRALRAEEELQAALGKIQDLERELQSRSRAEPQPAEGTNTVISSKMEKERSSDVSGITFTLMF